MRIIQLLEWRLNDITNELNDIKNQGFTHIQTSPLSKTKDKNKEFWKFYQPCSMTIGNTQCGSKEDLINLCTKAHEIGLKIIVDVVLRHVASDNLDTTKPHENVDLELLPFIINRPVMNENSRYSITHDGCGVPTLDVENLQYQKIVIRYLDELKSCGVDNFRQDMTKHFKLPSEGGTFLTNVMCRYGNDWIGEVLFEENKDILNLYADLGMVLSVNTLSNRKDRFVAFVENHDTFLNDGGIGFTKKMSDELIHKEYGIICSKFPNTLFYARPFNTSWKSEYIKHINNRYTY